MSGVKQEYMGATGPELPPEFITSHFRWAEAACPCGCKTPDVVRVRVLIHARELEYVRELLGAPIVVTSWYRCDKHNREIGGAPEGRHPKGDGTDLRVDGRSGEYLLGFFEALMSGDFIAMGGLGTYEDFPHILHYDSRLVWARWHKPKKEAL